MFASPVVTETPLQVRAVFFEQPARHATRWRSGWVDPPAPFVCVVVPQRVPLFFFLFFWGKSRKRIPVTSTQNLFLDGQLRAHPSFMEAIACQRLLLNNVQLNPLFPVTAVIRSVFSSSDVCLYWSCPCPFILTPISWLHVLVPPPSFCGRLLEQLRMKLLLPRQSFSWSFFFSSTLF